MKKEDIAELITHKIKAVIVHKKEGNEKIAFVDLEKLSELLEKITDKLNIK
jgi:hypothetical protein